MSNNSNTLIHTFKHLLTSIYRKGFFHLLTANFTIQIVGFLSQLFVAWLVSPEDMGRIKIMQAYTTIAAIVAGLGFNTSVLKLCSEKRTLEEKRALFNNAVRFTLIATLLTASGIIVCALTGIISPDTTLNYYFLLYTIALIPIAFNRILTAYLQALKKIKELANIQMITKLTGLGMIVLLTYFFGMEGFIGGIIFAFGLTSIFFIRKIRSLHKGLNPFSGIKNPLKIHWSLAKFAFSSNVITQVSVFLDLILINYLIVDRAAVGYYSFALTLLVALQLITITVQQIAIPYFSEKGSDFKEWLRVFKKYYLLFLILSTLITALALFISPTLIKFAFAGKYDASIPFLNIFIISWFIRNLYSFVGPALIGLGKLNINFYNAVIVLLASILPYYYLMNNYDILGAAYGNVASKIIACAVIGISFFIVVSKKSKDQTKAI
ncbi:MAG: oligosaccharide flippase family protein [Bacteroidetes bacterium]|nr:oligosaccharide flippase family protein [Bacteroidota bacterium]